MIYQHDPNTKAYFHNYIDNSPNILCLAKTVKGIYVAAYYSDLYIE
jgi:hypothetical protein